MPPRRTATPSSRSSTEAILVGEVLKPHGIKGEVVIRPHTDNPDRFAPGSGVLLGPSYPSAQERIVESARPHQGRLIVKFRGVGDRNAAEELRGQRVFAEETPDATDATDATDAPDGYWHHQLIGMMVETPDGTVLGEVSAIHERPGQDLWEVRVGERSVLVPAARDIVVEVDLDGRRIVVDPPEGLFDEA